MVVTISSWLNFGRPAPQGGGLRRGENSWLLLTTASAQCLRLLWVLFSLLMYFSFKLMTWLLYLTYGGDWIVSSITRKRMCRWLSRSLHRRSALMHSAARSLAPQHHSTISNSSICNHVPTTSESTRMTTTWRCPFWNSWSRDMRHRLSCTKWLPTFRFLFCLCLHLWCIQLHWI